MLEANLTKASRKALNNSSCSLILADKTGLTSRSNLNATRSIGVPTASFKTGATTKGSISVIGPTRMPYEKVVSLVEYISKNIEQAFFDESDDSNDE